MGTQAIAGEKAAQCADLCTIKLTTIAEEPHRLGLGDEVNIILNDGVNHPRSIQGTVTEVCGL